MSQTVEYRFPKDLNCRSAVYFKARRESPWFLLTTSSISLFSAFTACYPVLRPNPDFLIAVVGVENSFRPPNLLFIVLLLVRFFSGVFPCSYLRCQGRFCTKVKYNCLFINRKNEECYRCMPRVFLFWTAIELPYTNREHLVKLSM